MHSQRPRQREERPTGWLDRYSPPYPELGMDFVSGTRFDGQRVPSLTVVDNSRRECLAVVLDQNLRGEDVFGDRRAFA